MIPKIKKILYATDLSKNSSYAFLYAVEMARQNHARIVILHALEPLRPRPWANALAGLDENELEKGMKHEQKAEHSEIRKRVEGISARGWALTWALLILSWCRRSSFPRVIR